jgi:arsenite-transporting ATPase
VTVAVVAAVKERIALMTIKHPFSTLSPMDWQGWQTPFLFFTGKGGVGKTTIASTVALRLAEMGRRVLLVSTDPASNLDDVFEMTSGSTITPVPNVSGLFLLNIDPEAAAAAYRAQVITPYVGVLPVSTVQSMEEQLSGACTVEIAAFNEFTSLLADPHMVSRFEHIVFDTAPTGHTLRLLSLPKAWSGFLETNRHGASCLGPLAGLQAQQEQYAATVQILGDATRTTIVLVSRPEESSLQEAARAGEEFHALSITNQHLVLNGILTASAGDDPIAQAMVTRQQEALRTMPPLLRETPTVAVPLMALELTGVAALRQLADTTGQTMPASTTAKTGEVPDASAIQGLEELVRQVEADGPGVIMLMGKGGVGKTTLAAALAVALAHAGHRVHLSTTDPAAHVEQTVGADHLECLQVSRIDPAAETRRYSEEVLAAAGPLDEEERALLEEDLRSPCTEEIAVFRAFARTVQEAERSFVVLDTAPTGHTLLLLDAAQSYHREVERTMGDVPEAVRRLLPRLRDPRFTKILLVTLAESTPIQEAQRLQADLRRAAIEPFGWVINASLLMSGTANPVLLQRAQIEMPHLRRVTQELAVHSWLVPWYASIPMGEQALLAMTKP